MNTYLVTGVSRSGTSNTARIMHEELGIHMGNDFRVQNELNPGGFYEDEAFIRLNKFLIRNQMHFSVWALEMQRKIEICNSRGVSWGFKDPDIWLLLGFFIGVIPNLRIVVCVRDMDLVVKSIVKNWNNRVPHATPIAGIWNKERAERAWFERNMILSNQLKHNPNVLTIEYHKELKPDEEIIKQFKDRWGDV